MAHMLEMGARRRRPARGRCRVVSLLATSATLLLGIGLLPQTLEVGFAEGTLSSLRVSPLPSMNACHHGAPARTCMRAKPKPGPRKDTKAQTDALDERKKKDDVIEIEGTVLMHSRNIFKVELTNGCEVECKLAGKLRMNKIRVLEGDRVTVEMSPYDLTKGRIVFRTIPKLPTDKPTK
eukprot:TRINITY_DN5414_c0_g1_i1.p2 TRINITY_DN5414_c0_g1~~TRINITY_DN5414_c0_g1_i1.p2  ORF type:complete len:179 (-),score=22.58 TRINITY_DN5414_c0_g1_i1:31-567(-)